MRSAAHQRSNFIGFSRIARPIFEVSDEVPAILEYKDLIHIPTVNALYRRDGILIPESRRIHVDQSMISTKTSDSFWKKIHAIYPPEIEVPQNLDVVDQPVVLLGNNNGHFGHFLLEGLARMWAVLSGDVSPGEDRILITNGTPQAPFARQFFEPLGIGYDEISSPLVPTLYRNVKIVSPMINYTFRVNRRLPEVHRELSRRMKSDRRFDRPVFISRAGVRNGLHIFHGEDVLETEMSRKGFETVRPETLTFSDQMALFAKCPLIVGSIGSAFHNILFEPANGCVARIMMSSEDVGHRFLMVDAVCPGHMSWYLNVMPKFTKRGEAVTINIDAAREMMKKIGIL